MTRVANLAQQTLALNSILNSQERVQDAQIKIATGAKSLDYAGLSASATRLVSLESVQSRTSQFIDNNRIITNRLELMDSAVSTIFDTTIELRTTLLQALNDASSGQVPLATVAQNLLDVVAGQLNIKDNGRYIFAGSKTSTPPVDVSGPNSTVTQQEATTGIQNLAGRGFVAKIDASSTKVTSGDAFRLSYDTIGGTVELLSLTNLTTGVTKSIDVKTVVDAKVVAGGQLAGSDLKSGETVEISFPDLGVTVTLVGDDIAGTGFTRGTDVIAAGSITATNLATSDITVNGSATYVNDVDGGVANAAITDLLASTDYDKITGLLTVNMNTGAGSVTLAATNGVLFSVDGGAYSATPATNLDDGGSHTVAIKMSGGNSNSDDIIAVMTLNDIDGSVGAGPSGFTIDVGDLMFGADITAGGAGYYSGDSAVLSTRIDETTTISYGMTADRKAFQDVISALKEAIDGSNTNNRSKLESALTFAQSAIQSIAGYRTEIGSDMVTIERANQRNNDFIVFVDGVVTDIKNVDIPSIVSLLATEQVILEASFLTLARVSRLTLVDFLR